MLVEDFRHGRPGTIELGQLDGRTAARDDGQRQCAERA